MWDRLEILLDRIVCSVIAGGIFATFISVNFFFWSAAYYLDKKADQSPTPVVIFQAYPSDDIDPQKDN